MSSKNDLHMNGRVYRKQLGNENVKAEKLAKDQFEAIFTQGKGH